MNAHLSFAQIAPSDRLPRGGMAGGPTFVQNGGAQRPSRRPPWPSGWSAMMLNGFFAAAVLLIYAALARAMGLDIKFHAVINGPMSSSRWPSR